MLRKKAHHRIKMLPLCGEIIEILRSPEHPRINIAMVLNIKPTQDHYHQNFEEIYFVQDGHIALGRRNNLAETKKNNPRKINYRSLMMQ